MKQIEPGPKFRLGNGLSLKLRTWSKQETVFELRTWEMANRLSSELRKMYVWARARNEGEKELAKSETTQSPCATFPVHNS